MKDLYIRRLSTIAALLIWAFFMLGAGVIGCSSGQEAINSISYISFSHDGKKILFNRSKGSPETGLLIYDLDTGQLGGYRFSDRETWSMARYSYDGKSIVLVIIPLIGEPTESKRNLDFSNAQIAIMDPDGRNLRTITNSPGLKIYPSFSHSGKKIIFARADKITEKRRTPAMDYDIFEVDIETGKEARLTYFSFFEVSPPFYLPDDMRFVFSAYGPTGFPVVTESGDLMCQKRDPMDIVTSNYGQRDDIYVMRAGELKLKPFVVLGKEEVRLPLISADGTRMFFTAQARKPDGAGDSRQFYLYSPDGKHRQITRGRPSKADWSSAVSPDGELLAYVSGGSESRMIGICTVADGNCREISLPDQVNTINSSSASD